MYRLLPLNLRPIILLISLFIPLPSRSRRARVHDLQHRSRTASPINSLPSTAPIASAGTRTTVLAVPITYTSAIDPRLLGRLLIALRRQVLFRALIRQRGFGVPSRHVRTSVAVAVDGLADARSSWFGRGGWAWDGG
jgi:hypothetical protein